MRNEGEEGFEGSEDTLRRPTLPCAAGSPPERRARMGGRRKTRNRRWRVWWFDGQGKRKKRNKGGEYIYIYIF